MSITASQLVAEVRTDGIDSAKSQLSGMGDFVNTIGAMFKNGLGGALSLASNLAGQSLNFLKDQLVDSVKVAMQHQDVMAQTVQALKSTHDASGMTAQSIDDLASSLSRTTPFAEDVTQRGENLLLTFTGIGKQVFPAATQAMMDMAQAMHQGPEQGAIMLGKALNDPTTGLTALTRVGVTFSDEEKKQIKTMMAHNDIVGAQKVMLKELATEFGGSAVAAGKTFGGSLQVLQNNLEDVKQKIGTALIPILSQLSGWVSTSVMPALDKFGAWFSSTGGPALQGFFQGLTQFFSSVDFTPLTYALSNLGSALGGILSPLSGVGNALKTINFKQVGEDLKIGFLQAMFAVSRVLNMAADAIRTVQGVFEKLHPTFVAIGSFVAANFLPVWHQLTELWKSSLLPSLQQLWSGIQPMLPLLGLLAALIGGVLVGAIAGAIKGFAGFLSGVMIVLSGVVQAVTGAVQVVGGIIGFFTDLVTGHFNKLGSDLGLVWQGILNIFGGAWKAIIGVFQTAWFTISGVVTGFVEGIIGFFTHLSDVLVGHSIIPDMVNAVVSWFEQLPGRAMSFVMQFVGKVTSELSSLGSKALKWGEDMISGFISGIQNAMGGLGKTISDVASTISSHLHFSKPEVGELADADKWMPDFIDLMSQGLLAGVPKLKTAMGQVVAPLSLSPVSGGSSAFLPAGAAAISSSFAQSVASLGGPSSGQMQPIVLQINEHQLGRVMMPIVANRLRYGVGVQGQ